MPSSTAEPPTTTLVGARVLLVEDNDINQQVAQEILEGFGLTVEIAGEGRKAVELLRADPNRYDTVLMDLQMPELDGFEATRIIRSELGLANLPIIAMTARVLEDERRHCLACGMNDHVAKPIDPPTLLAVLSRLLTPIGHEGEFPKEPTSALEFPASFPGVDLPSALSRLSGNRELLLKLLRNFGRGWAGVTESLQADLAAGDLQKAQITAHSLRGVAANLSIVTVAAAAEALEQALKREDHNTIERGMETLTASLAPVITGLEQLPSTPPLPVATGPIDRPLLEQQLTNLAELLRRHNLEADNCFATLRAHLGAGEWSEAMNRMEEQMDRLDFAGAGKTLTEVAEILGIEVAGKTDKTHEPSS
jgi:CheY-like chemotaxis protein